jgi:uncharacterized membrane protein YeiB
MDQPNFPQAVVALGFFALLGFVLWLAVDNYDDFNKAWGLVAPLVGVVIGLIPSYFFHSRATAAEAQVEQKDEEVQKTQTQVRTLLEKVEPDVVAEAKASAPDAWSAA